MKLILQKSALSIEIKHELCLFLKTIMVTTLKELAISRQNLLRFFDLPRVAVEAEELGAEVEEE